MCFEVAHAKPLFTPMSPRHHSELELELKQKQPLKQKQLLFAPLSGGCVQERKCQLSSRLKKGLLFRDVSGKQMNMFWIVASGLKMMFVAHPTKMETQNAHFWRLCPRLPEVAAMNSTSSGVPKPYF
jgi:hypothetical protein